jgi:preprotein translocase subunit SecY
MSGELTRRIAFTVGALLVYRVGSYIPLPGTDAAAWGRITGAHSRDIFGLIDMPSAGAARHFAVFALGILPYITAAILIQLASIGSSRLRALSAAGDRGRQKIVAYTLYLTLILAAFQAYGLALALEGLRGLVAQPGLIFQFTTMLTLTAGTLLLVWLSNQITAHGIGNGLVLILAVGLLVNLPPNIAVAVERVRHGIVSVDMIVMAMILAAVVTALIVVVEGARHVIVVEYPKREIGGITIESRSAPLMLKLNSAGLIPTVVAGWLIVIVAFGFIFGAGANSAVVRQLGHGHPLFMILFSVLVVLLTLFYTAFLLDPEMASEQLKAYGGVVPGIAAGEATADHLDNVISRVTLIGAIYLALVFVLPEILIVYFGLPFYLGGASFLIVVCVALDIGAQLKQNAQLMSGSSRL